MESNVNKVLFKGIKIAGTILIMLLVLYGTLRASLLAYDFGYRVFNEPPVEKEPGTAVVVTIEEDMEAMDIAEHLLGKGLIRDKNLFWLQYQLSAYKDELIPGTYTLSTSMTPKEILIVLADEAEAEEDTEDSSTKSTESTEK